MSKLLYTNKYYRVELVVEDKDNPYHVIHQEHNAESINKYDNYPQALIIAEQFSNMLFQDTWKRTVLAAAPPLELAVDNTEGSPTH